MPVENKAALSTSLSFHVSSTPSYVSDIWPRTFFSHADSDSSSCFSFRFCLKHHEFAKVSGPEKDQEETGLHPYTALHFDVPRGIMANSYALA